MAKNVVAAGLADRCEVQVAYAIGVAHPVSIAVRDVRHRARSRCRRSRSSSREHFDLRPAAILRDLDLRRPIYAKTAAYGHFGRDDHDFTWERTDKADALREAAGRRRCDAYRLGLAHEEAGGGLLADRLLVAVQAHGELAGGRLRLAHLDLGPGHEALVVEPVQELAVVLGEADDRRACVPAASAESGASSRFSACSNVRVDRPAVRAAVGVAELLARSARSSRR